MDKPISIEFLQDTPVSLDGLTTTQKKKGEKATAATARQNRLFHHLVQSGKAKAAGSDSVETKEQAPAGQKVAKPKEEKATKGKKKKSDG